MCVNVGVAIPPSALPGISPSRGEGSFLIAAPFSAILKRYRHIAVHGFAIDQIDAFQDNFEAILHAAEPVLHFGDEDPLFIPPVFEHHQV